MNNVVLTGRITKDPELRKTNDGTSVVSFSLAVPSLRKNEKGDNLTDFINCVAWKQSADFMAQYVKKGYLLCVSGSVQTRSYEKDGVNKTVTEVICSQVENMQPREYEKGEKKESKPTEQAPVENKVADINDDDLPF